MVSRSPELQPRDPRRLEEIEQLINNVSNAMEVANGNHTHPSGFRCGQLPDAKPSPKLRGKRQPITLSPHRPDLIAETTRRRGGGGLLTAKMIEIGTRQFAHNSAPWGKAMARQVINPKPT